MSGLTPGFPCGAEIAQLGLDALDLQSYRAATREYKCYLAARGVFLLELNREQRHHRAFRREIDAMGLGVENALEPERSPAALKRLPSAVAPFRCGPVEAVHDCDEPLFGGQIGHVADQQHGVLQMYGEDREILCIEGE